MDQYVLPLHVATADARSTPQKRPASSLQEEVALYNRFLAGDDSACMEMFHRYNQRLYTYCVKMVGDLEYAEDLTQESWGRLIELRLSGRSLHNPIGFLMRIARNLCLDHLKARKRLLSLDSIDESALPISEIPEPSEMEELVVGALQDLSFDYREVLVLNIYCGYSFEEIATMLGKSSEAIWTRASRARAQLRKMVQSAKQEQGTALRKQSTRGGRV